MVTISILQEKEFPLLQRRSYILKMEFPQKPTPSMAEVKKQAAAFLRAEENRVAVKNIEQQFGTNTALVTINLYKEEKALKALEEVKKRKKKGEQESGKDGESKK